MFGTKNHRRDTRHASDSKTKRLSFERIEPRLMLSVAPSELEGFFQDAPDEPLEGILWQTQPNSGLVARQG